MSAKSLIDSFGRAVHAPKDVARLRTSILTLAMTGRLTDVVTSNWEHVELQDCATVYNGRAYKQHELLSSGTPSSAYKTSTAATSGITRIWRSDRRNTAIQGICCTRGQELLVPIFGRDRAEYITTTYGNWSCPIVPISDSCFICCSN